MIHEKFATTKSVGTYPWEIFDGNSVGKDLWEIFEKTPSKSVLGKFSTENISLKLPTEIASRKFPTDYF